MKPKLLRMKPSLLTPHNGATQRDPTPEQRSMLKFEPAAWNGKNSSGYYPLGDKVLVMPDRLRERSAGGVELPPELIDRLTLAAETGMVVAVGDGAFAWNGDRITDFVGRKPKPGDRVFMERYAGQTMLGKDGQFYRLMDDRTIGAIKETNDE